MLIQLLLAFLLAAAVALAAYRAHALSRSGALTAALLGTIIFGLGGLAWAVLLLGFFISSSLLSHLFARRKAALNEKFSKGSRRDAAQVLANGGVAGLLVLLHAAFPSAAWPWVAFAGTLAAVNADTWATELGVLSKSTPRLITTGRPVERGTSGGVTPGGTLAALAGALLIGLLALPLWQNGGETSGAVTHLLRLAVIGLAGLAGSLIDSLLGATLQAIYHCPACEKETERHPLHTCGTATTRIRGLAWLNNDWVNITCALAGGLLALAAGTLLTGPLGLHPAAGLEGANMIPLTVSTPAFKPGDPIPEEYTCKGEDRSPALTWSKPPTGTRSLALIVEDPDAPVGVFTHWVLYNMPANLIALPGGLARDAQLAGTGTQGFNDFRHTGFNGPCPPAGKPHRYYFRLYALDLEPNLPVGLNVAGLRTALQGHVLAQGELMGTFKR